MAKYQHIFFDLDNTLWDFDKSSLLAFDKIYDIFKLINYGIPSASHFHHTYFEHNNRLWELYRQGKIDKDFLKTERFRLPLKDYGIVDERLATDLGESYTDYAARLVALVPHTLEVLNYLKEKNYNIHLITNGFLEVQSIKMEASGLDKLIDTSFVSEVVGFKKPDHRIFHYAVENVGATLEECIMIGDDLINDIKGAMDLGIKAIAVDHFDKIEVSKDYKVVKRIRELKEIL